MIIAVRFQCCLMAPLRAERRYAKEDEMETPLDEVEDADWITAANDTLREPLAGDASNVTPIEVSAWLFITCVGRKYDGDYGGPGLITI